MIAIQVQKIYLALVVLLIVSTDGIYSQSVAVNLNETLKDNNKTVHILQETAFELITRLKKVTKESSESHEMANQENILTVTKALLATELRLADMHKQHQRKLNEVLNKFIPSRQNSMDNNSTEPKAWTFTKTSENIKSKDERTALLERSIEQNRLVSDNIVNSLKTDILRLSSAEIRREDILNFIRSKQPSFTYADANNLLIEAHMSSDVQKGKQASSASKAKAAAIVNSRRSSLPKSNMDSFSQAQEMKANRAIKEFVKSSIALEFDRMNLINNITMT